MSHRQNMRVQVKPPKLDWRTIAIADTDPVAFARSLQTALQELTDNQYNIVTQLTRGTAHIILANRVMLDTAVEGSMLPTIPPPLQSRATPRAARAVLAKTSVGPAVVRSMADCEIYYYHYLSPDGPQDRSFDSMVGALRLVREHVLGNGDFVPGYLVCMVTTTFESPAFSALLRTYAEEIDASPIPRAD